MEKLTGEVHELLEILLVHGRIMALVTGPRIERGQLPVAAADGSSFSVGGAGFAIENLLLTATGRTSSTATLRAFEDLSFVTYAAHTLTAAELLAHCSPQVAAEIAARHHWLIDSLQPEARELVPEHLGGSAHAL